MSFVDLVSDEEKTPRRKTPKANSTNTGSKVPSNIYSASDVSGQVKKITIGTPFYMIDKDVPQNGSYPYYGVFNILRIKKQGDDVLINDPFGTGFIKTTEVHFTFPHEGSFQGQSASAMHMQEYNCAVEENKDIFEDVSEMPLWTPREWKTMLSDEEWKLRFQEKDNKELWREFFPELYEESMRPSKEGKSKKRRKVTQRKSKKKTKSKSKPNGRPSQRRKGIRRVKSFV